MSTPLVDPFAPFGALLSGFEGLYELERIRRGMFLHATAPRPDVGVTPHVVVHEQDKLKLRYYAPKRDEGLPPVVLVPSLINRAYILDLESDRSMVASLAAMNHPVYLVDWGEPGPEDADEDVSYVVLELLDRAVRRACRHARAPKAAVFGYCMGGTLVAMYAALRPERLLGFATLNAPVLFAEAGRFREFVSPDVVNVDEVFPAGTLVPTWLMKPVFQMLDPMGSFTKYAAIEQAAADPKKLSRTMARERWLEEHVPCASAFCREFVRNAYQEDALINGRWSLGGETVRLEAITSPALIVVCKRDFIAPSRSGLPLFDRIQSADKELVEPDAGHIGVVVGATGPRYFFPLLDKWLRRIAQGEPQAAKE
jgi:polyhydroxyalkanoate synthase